MPSITDEDDLANFDGEVLFPAMSLLNDSQCEAFSPRDDDILEGDHSLIVAIDSTNLPASVTVGMPSNVTIVISDDEGKAVIQSITHVLVVV